MSDLELLVDLHRGGKRQGPGQAEDTRLAITLSGLRSEKSLSIADLGCGTGASTIVLAQELDATLIAVDLFDDFLKVLRDDARQLGLDDRISTDPSSMETLPFDSASLDAIWSEGAIYNIGFNNGIQSFHRFLKPGGILAVSELTWLTDQRPAELEAHWAQEYPEVATASTKMAQLEAAGYTPIGYFALSPKSWLDHYYRPLQARFPDFLARNNNSATAQAIVASEEYEIALYERHVDFISYGYYIARKTDN